MSNTDICITIILSVLGVALPILLQVISTLDDKYASVLLVQLFNREKIKNCFIISLVAATITAVLFMLQIPPMIDGGVFSPVLENSATKLLYLATALMVLFLFLFVFKITQYLMPMQLITGLTRRHNRDKQKEENNFVFFRVITEMLFYALNKQNVILADTIMRFMGNEFSHIRQDSAEKKVTYPYEYYLAVNNIIGEMGAGYNKRLEFVAFAAAGNRFYLGDLSLAKMSESTFDWMWRNLLLSLQLGKEDFVMEHWEAADQAAYHLRESSIDDRMEFLEFHHALCALVLHEKRYALLKRLFEFTRTDPPQYELLPTMMGEVFLFYFRMITPMRSRFFSHSNPFPGWEGVGADIRIEHAMRAFLALLYVRQFTLPSQYIYLEPTAMPAIPATQSEKKKWIDFMDMFRSQVSDILGNRTLLQTLEFDIPVEFGQNPGDTLHPLTFIDQLKKKLEDHYQDTLVNQEPELEKIQQFETTSRDVIIRAWNDVIALSNDSTPTKPVKKYFVNSVWHLFDKTAFAKGQDAEHANFHSVLANEIARKIPAALSETFVTSTTHTYLLQPADVEDGLEKLKLDDSHIIVSCYQDLQYNKKGQAIVALHGSNQALVRDSLFILKKTDLPYLKLLPVKPELIEAYTLKKMDDTYHVYTSVIDLNHSERLRKEFSQEKTEDDLRRMVLAAVFINCEIAWKQDMQMIRIEAFSPYNRSGIPNTLQDIRPLK